MLQSVWFQEHTSQTLEWLWVSSVGNSLHGARVVDAADPLLAGHVNEVALHRVQFRSAFCAVRPPGHHAGPTGVVPCANEPTGSHGFCLFSNLAIGAAYAMTHYQDAGLLSSLLHATYFKLPNSLSPPNDFAINDWAE